MTAACRLSRTGKLSRLSARLFQRSPQSSNSREALHAFGEVTPFAYHVGKRTPEDTANFANALGYATRGRFHLTTDGYPPYRSIIPFVLANRRIDFATLTKVYGESEEDGKRRYSPAEVIGTIETPIMGDPDEGAICTSHVERSNLTLRMQIRRLTRLTNAHSKKWENHEAAMALFFAYYNFCRVHMTLRKTPANETGLTSETWSLDRLLAEASRV